MSSSSGWRFASATSSGWGRGSIAVTRTHAPVSQVSSSLVKSPRKAPTSTTDLGAAASRQPKRVSDTPSSRDSDSSAPIVSGARSMPPSLPYLLQLRALTGPETARQDKTAVARNREFFAGERWAQQISEIDTYRLIRAAIEAEVAGTG